MLDARKPILLLLTRTADTLLLKDALLSIIIAAKAYLYYSLGWLLFPEIVLALPSRLNGIQ